jgi:UDP-N-acetylmuramate--alanine ligase
MGKNKVIYFLGIGGIGMSALARFFKKNDNTIYGYDLTPTPLTKQLEKEGMFIHYNEDISIIPENIDMVIYTPAVPKENKEFQYFVDNNITLKKRSEILGELSETYFTIAVAGTHGKTSISSLAAHILKTAGKNLTAIIGGIAKNYNSNYITSEKTEILLLEADEYDRSFLHLHPDMSVISSVDADHLDIYGNDNELKNNFLLFAKQLNTNGKLIYHKSLLLFENLKTNKITYSALENADCHASNIKVENGNYIFNLTFGDMIIKDISLSIPGLHYIENALAAAIIGFETGLSPEEIKTGLETFKGVVRRFEYRIKSKDIVFIDDYAHHPNELKVTIDAVKTLYPDKKITGVFQPHLYSRTKDFANDFALALEPLDDIVLLDIYPARERPIKNVTSKLILEKINNKNKKLLSKSQLKNYLKQNKPEVLLTLGAGDIGLMVDEIVKIFKS